MSLWLWALSWLSLWQQYLLQQEWLCLPRMTSWTTATDVNMRVQYPVLLASQHYMVEPVAAVLAATTVAVPPKNDKLDHRNGCENACAVPSLACKPTLIM
jgi:hypothetical protein